MVKIKVIKTYDDIPLKRKVLKGEEMEVDAIRAKKLHSLGLIEISSIFKLSKKEYEAIRSIQEVG